MAEPGTPLRIFEIGGGTGTLARDILDHLRGSVPDVYREVVYRMVEISPVLARLQERTIADVGGHSDHFQVTRHACIFTPTMAFPRLCRLSANI